jgi:Arc/MetJ-type ribon-helix-helix transcriptional regulator
MPRITSMDVTIRGVTRTFDFGTGEPVSSDEEGPASLELLEEAETTEVQLKGNAISNATVSVSFTYRYEGTVSVELSNIDDCDSVDELRDMVERGEFSDIDDAVTNDIEYNLGSENVSIDSVEDIKAFDDEGEEVTY